MTASFVFELRSKIEPEKIQQQLSKIWTRSVDSFVEMTISFCNLMMAKVLI
ncbi:MAG: hypothetical protein AAFO95_01485 [Cyanobacteria bacterium J06600_6]